MSRQKWRERLDDAVNPIVVKELRQAVHGRFLPSLLLVFLCFQLATLGVYLVTEGASGIDLLEGASHGEEVFGILVSLLLFASVICVPIYAAVRMARERSNEGLALYFISTLPPRRVISGKLASNLIVSALLFCACLPYLSFTYFLRGIDLPTVFAALVVGLAVSAGGILSGLVLASMRVSKILRLLLGLVGLGWLALLFSASIGWAVSLRRVGVASYLNRSDLWGPALVVLIPSVLLCGLLFVLAVALVTPANANRALAVRGYITLAWLLATVVVVLDSFLRSGPGDLVVLWALIAYWSFAISILVAICGRDEMSQRVAREVPRSSWGRMVAFPLFSGSANGVVWASLMIGATLAVNELCNRRFSKPFSDLAGPHLGFCAYILAYALLAVLLQRGVAARWVRRDQTGVLALVLITILSLIPPIIAFLLSPAAVSDSESLGLWLILNPFAVFSEPFDEVAIYFACGWAALMVVLARRWLLQQVLAFQPVHDG